MTPLPWDNRDKRANTQKLFFEDSFVNLGHFSVTYVHFFNKTNKLHKVHAQKKQGRHFPEEKQNACGKHIDHGVVGGEGHYLTKSMMYSRKVKVYKCQYVHFAHIRLSFGCTDEKIDLGICLHTYTRLSCF